MTVLREVLARFGIDVETGPLENAEKGIGQVIGNLRTLGATLGAGVGISQLVGFVNTSANLADELADVSERLGISTQGLQQWQYAAKLSGIEAEAFRGGLGILQRNLAGAASGNADAAATFRKLGVEVKNADGSIKPLDDVLSGLAVGIAGVDDPTRRAGLAVKLFGRSGAQLVPLLSRGSEGIAELRAEFESLGGGASDEAIHAAAQYNDGLDRLNQSVFSLRMRLLTALLPTFQKVAEVALSISGKFLQLSKNSNILTGAVAALGVIVAGFAIQFAAGFGAPLLLTLKLIALFVVFAAVVDEVITMFSGGRTVIGDFIDTLFGLGASAFFVETLKLAWEAVVYQIERAIHAVEEFFGIESEAPAAPTGDAAARWEEARRKLFEASDQDAALQGAAQRATPAGMFQAEGFAANLASQRWNAIQGPTRGATPAPVTASVLRSATLPAQGAAANRTTTATINSPLTVNVAPGTSREQVEATRRVVAEVLDQRNRQAAAAMTGETVEP